jgi:Phage derived protein Gp49-like (DUF891)
VDERKEWRWQFLGFESVGDGRVVQDWFDNLPDDVRDEIRDLLGYLEKMTDRLWKKPEFDPLAGAGGISELRPKDVSVEVGGRIEAKTYRIYGFFPKDRPHTYIFLCGKRKDVKNDEPGKRVAKRRLEQLIRGEATVHKFEF